MSAPRLAHSLATLRDQCNAAAPKRSKKSDGWIGDTAHSARKSDHNPNARGVVQALDITHDPKNGMNSYGLAETLRLSRDPRIKYVISNGRIFSATESPWQWRKYSGSNKHSMHVHVSVADDPKKYDDDSEWDIGLYAVVKPKPVPAAPPPPAAAPIEREVIKPAIQSKSIWAAIGTVAASIGGALTDWKVAAVLVGGALAAFLIWDRMKRRDIKGVVRTKQ